MYRPCIHVSLYQIKCAGGGVIKGVVEQLANVNERLGWQISLKMLKEGGFGQGLL